MNNNWGKGAVLAVALAVAVGPAVADTSKEGLEGITANDLLQLLVKEGIVSPDKLKELADKIKTRERKQSEAAVEPVAVEQRDQKAETPSGVVRVPYIPTYVRDEIRDQVRVGLKEDVTKDVLAQAKTERWGIPGVSPDWVDRIKLYGDARLRLHGDRFASDNIANTYFNLNGFNSAGKTGSAIPTTDYYYNTTEDRYRLRTRLRLGLEAKISTEIKAGGRIVTGTQKEPGSANQTIGTYGAKYPTDFDLAYINYTNIDKSVYLAGGRITNPFVSTDLIWHPDLTFEGVVGTWRPLRSNDLGGEFQQFDPFVTVGAFPIQEINQSSQDKWLYAAQMGFDFTTDSQSKFSAAFSYYYFNNMRGVENDVDSIDNNFTAPDYFQKGNSVFNIMQPDTNQPSQAVPIDAVRYALLSDYHLANLTLNYDYAGFSPFHVLLTADYVKNLGFDQGRISDIVGSKVAARVKGYQFKMAAGWPVVQKRYDWQVSLAYKYLERDAVVDAFTDSDFHLGGTDGKGYILRFDYGLADNTALSFRWMSTDEIDGKLINAFPPDGYPTGKARLGVDTLLLDLNTKF